MGHAPAVVRCECGAVDPNPTDICASPRPRPLRGMVEPRPACRSNTWSWHGSFAKSRSGRRAEAGLHRDQRGGCHPQSRTHRGPVHGLEAEDARRRRPVQSCEEPAGADRSRWLALSADRRAAQGPDRACDVGQTRSRQPRWRSISPRRPTGSRSSAGRWATRCSTSKGSRRLAALPSLDELRATIIGIVQAPATKIARTVSEPGAQLARIFSAYAAKEAA